MQQAPRRTPDARASSPRAAWLRTRRWSVREPAILIPNLLPAPVHGDEAQQGLGHAYHLDSHVTRSALLINDALRLFASARLVARTVCPQGRRQSPEDLMFATLTQVLEDQTVQYRKNRGPLVPFLREVLRNDVVDLLRKKAYKTTVIILRQSSHTTVTA